MKIVIANHKNYLNKKETLSFLKKMRKVEWKSDVILCPSIVFISLCNKPDLIIGSQYVSVRSPFSSGTSVEQLSDLNVKYCIVGHSDNRNYQGETYEDVFSKSKKLLKNDIIPVLCFSESEKTISDGSLLSSIENQIQLIEGAFNKEEIEKVIFAYEPFYNINNSKFSNATLDTDRIKLVLDFFKEKLESRYDSKIKVLYGGNVNSNNIASLNEIETLDGYLIGRSSSEFDELNKMMNFLNNT